MMWTTGTEITKICTHNKKLQGSMSSLSTRANGKNYLYEHRNPFYGDVVITGKDRHDDDIKVLSSMTQSVQ